jgi:type IV secretory pathway VirB10-like protein
MKYFSEGFVLNILILIFSAFFLFGCSSTKPAAKPTSVPEPTIEETKKEEPPPKPSKPDAVSSAKPSPPQSPTPSPTPKVTPAPPLRVTKVLWASVNLREGPGTNYKVIGNLKKGTSLTILETKGNWLRVRLEDGSEAWVSKLATSEAPNTAPTTPLKPKPM